MLIKKKLVFITAVVILLISLLFFALPEKQPSGSLSQPDLKPYFSKLASPSVSFTQLNSMLPEKKLPVFNVPDPDQNQLADFFQPMAQNLKLPQNPKSKTINSVPFLSWASTDGYLNVNLQTGQFSLKISHPSNKTAYINEIDALNLARNWLEQFNLINQESAVTIGYLSHGGQELMPQVSPSLGAYFQFNFTPEFNDQPVFSTIEHSFSPITIMITNQGQIFYVNYQLPVLALESAGLNSQPVKLKKLSQINQEISANKPVITLAESQPGISQSTLGQPDNITYQQFIPGYQFVRLQNQNLFLPILQLKGTATLDNKLQVDLTAFLSLMQE